MRVLFWGTPDFAAPAFRALLGEGFDVVGVVTQPDRPVGRSRTHLVRSPVKELALEESLPVLQPGRIGTRGVSDPAFEMELRALSPDISVVVAYGQILPSALIELPHHGTINVHASLLPQLRGAAPIQAAIRAGLSRTGISIMRVVPALDAGPVVLQVATPILDDETYGELSLRLSEMGALAVIEALSLLELGRATEQPQEEDAASYAPKVDRASTEISWEAPAVDVSRTIRAYDPKPGARTVLHGRDLKLFGARLAPSAGSPPPGTILSIDSDGMTVACGEAAVRVTAVQLAGGARIEPERLARGRVLKEGDRLGTTAA